LGKNWFFSIVREIYVIKHEIVWDKLTLRLSVFDLDIQMIEHREYTKFALAHLLFIIALGHTRTECFNDFFFLIRRLLVAAPCGTSRATLCWLDVPGDRITQRHRRLVKTEHKASKVLASRGTVTIVAELRAAWRFTAIKRPTLECYLSSFLFVRTHYYTLVVYLC